MPVKYCDLVMKGGITSGLVYPNAVLTLAREYRFKNIGGTSAGAIAAGMTAAAALGDRRQHAGEFPGDATQFGFGRLSEVAKALSTKGFIFGLFQPSRGAGPAFRLLLAGSTRSLGVPAIAARAALLVPTMAPIPFVSTLAALCSVGFLISGWSGVVGAALPGLLCALAVAGFYAVGRTSALIRENMLGVCSGMPSVRSTTKERLALTEWLHSELQTLSGKAGGEPLTFADLRNAPRYDDEPITELALDLRVIATDVSHHEPRSIPFENARFWFRLDQFERLFPSDVVEWLVERGGTPIEYAGYRYYRLAANDKLPVLVGVRMSLSFPLLLSAVPLHEPQRSASEAPDEQGFNVEQGSLLSSSEALTAGGTGSEIGALSFRPCWFSDGGISSNFPIHLFDAALPRWPTFAINLIAKEADGSRPDVFLPTENNQGWQRAYFPFDDPSAPKELLQFVIGIVRTMQNWRDLLQARAPGHRDRITHVALSAQEGGLNLDMPQQVLNSIAEKGARAGASFASFSFDNHYWVRWRNLASGLQRYTREAASHAKSPIPEFQAGYQTAKSGTPTPPSYKFDSQRQADAAQELLEELETNAAEEPADLTRGAPRPLPQLRITPTY